MAELRGPTTEELRARVLAADLTRHHCYTHVPGFYAGMGLCRYCDAPSAAQPPLDERRAERFRLGPVNSQAQVYM